MLVDIECSTSESSESENYDPNGIGDPGGGGSVPATEPRSGAMPRTLLDCVMECRDHPNRMMQQIAISQNQPFNVPDMCRLVGNVFNVHVSCRGRRDDCHITLRAPTGAQAEYVSNYISKLTRSGLHYTSHDFFGIESVTLVTCGIRFLEGLPHRSGMCAVRRRLTCMRARAGFTPIDYVIDCRNFGDPDFSRDVRTHIGTHPCIQMGIVMNEKFVDLLLWIKMVLS